MNLSPLFMIFSAMLAGILLLVALLTNPLLAIFIVCVIVCMAMNGKEDKTVANKKKKEDTSIQHRD